MGPLDIQRAICIRIAPLTNGGLWYILVHMDE